MWYIGLGLIVVSINLHRLKSTLAASELPKVGYLGRYLYNLGAMDKKNVYKYFLGEVYAYYVMLFRG